ncbi:MAG: hypothetical protein ACO4BJ_11420, partial [Planctomycetota bacterium]
MLEEESRAHRLVEAKADDRLALVGALTLSGCYYVDAVFDINDEEELDIRIDTAIHEDFANADTARSALQDEFSGEGMSRSNYAEGPWNGY